MKLRFLIILSSLTLFTLADSLKAQVTVGDPKIEGFYQGFINQKIPIIISAVPQVVTNATDVPLITSFARPIQVLGLFRVQIRLTEAGYYQAIGRNAVLFDSGRRYGFQGDISIIPEFPAKHEELAYYNFRTRLDPPGELDFDFELTGELKRADRKRGEYFDRIAFEDDEGEAVVSFVSTLPDIVILANIFPQPPQPNTRVELAKVSTTFFGSFFNPKIYR